jgi:hypothetical protein
MGVETAIFVNPYLLAIWKRTWAHSKYGDFSKSLTIDDWPVIQEISGIGIEYLPKILKTDTRVKRAKVSTLDKLCYALKSINKDFQSTWKEFELYHKSNKTFKDCESIRNKKKDSLIDATMLREIRKHSRIKAEQIFDEISNKSNLPLIDKSFEREEVLKKAEFEDIVRIYEFALDRYEDCQLNGPDIKGPWWEKNNNIFYVIKDNLGKVIANINLLPLKPMAYKKIAQGIIEEKDIKPDDLFSYEERSEVRHIYVEGFNCSKTGHFDKIIRFFPEIMKRLCTADKDVLIGAIGGTEAGESNMTSFGFDILTKAKDRLDECDFFEVSYHKLLRLHYRLL